MALGVRLTNPQLFSVLHSPDINRISNCSKNKQNGRQYHIYIPPGKTRLYHANDHGECASPEYPKNINLSAPPPQHANVFSSIVIESSRLISNYIITK